MKRITIFILLIFFCFNAYASTGSIKQNSIIECNGVYYGNHGNPLHWHIVENKNNKWVSISKEVEIPACYIKETNKMEKVLFSKCGDGDTARFIINGVEKKVRFLAIDTPEINDNSNKYGKEASSYTCEAIKNAKEIYLEYDGNSDKEDKYGRILAFVHVDGVLLEKSLVENGLARVYYIYGDYNHVDELKNSEETAKSKKIGIWSVEDDSDNDEISENIISEIIDIIIEIIKKIFDLLFK